MRKVALIFIVAVLVPSLALAWLAVRSLRDQQLVLERQQSLLYQGVADGLAREIAAQIAELQRGFGLEVESMLIKSSPREIAADFDGRLRKSWPLAEVGFAVSLDGQVLAPSLFDHAEARRFRLENDRFLCNRESVEVYWNSPKGAINLSQLDDKELPAQQPANKSVYSSSDLNAAREPKVLRNVAPQQVQQKIDVANFSKVAPAEADFRQLVLDSTEGTIARFLQNQLNLMFWYRSSRDPGVVFGALVKLDELTAGLKPVIAVEPESLQREIGVALLNETGRPVAMAPAALNCVWKRPFVATEIGEALPHWEVAVYLQNPDGVSRSARSIRLTLGLLIAVLVLAIFIGGWLIVTDLNRQLATSRQKTDFVSNVSHELKTPLTSIRMFSELLAEDRVGEPEKRRAYLQIITAETARLTRLINNVLDFSRLERGEKKYQFAHCDLVGIVHETIESYRPHLEQEGFKLECALPSGPVRVNGDRDALAQVIVNLLSNAEKYSGPGKEITVELRLRADPIPHAELRVLDRGAGVPRGCEEKIFEQFYRAHDSLSSGIQGSGLGLTLARQIARAHAGEVVYEQREGGGSCFALRLPVIPEPPEERRDA